MQNYLPGFEDKTPEKGFVEAETEKTINSLKESSLIGEETAGMCALAIMAARSLDQMGAKGAPSGRAMLLNAAREIFESLRPQTDPSAVNDLTQILDAIKSENGDESDVEFTHAVA